MSDREVLPHQSTLHCRECGSALDDGQLLRGRDLCLTCEEEDERWYGPEDYEYDPDAFDVEDNGCV